MDDIPRLERLQVHPNGKFRPRQRTEEMPVRLLFLCESIDPLPV